MDLSESYWENRYKDGATGWDAGAITTPLKEYVDQLETKELKILIPGAGNSYEAAYLFSNGFNEVYVLDVAKSPLENMKKRIPAFPESHLIQADFFEHEGQYDLIVEQTFYCAIDPSLRDQYVKHTHTLLKPGGKLVGLLWDAPMFSDHPPFGGNQAEYNDRFSPFFEIDVLAPAYNSIKPRLGNEVFIKFVKR